MNGSFLARHKKKIFISLGVVVVIFLLLWVILRDVAPSLNLDLVPANTTPPHTGDDPPAMGMWPDHPEQDDSTLMLVAISGGGSRAAAVGWKVLKELRRIPYRFTNAQGQVVNSNLGNEIDLVAGISGGAFAATAWCLGQDDAKFRKQFLERDIEGALAVNLLTAKGWLALFSRRYARINFAAELYDEEVFDRKKFAALPSRPILRLHATNLALGQRFTFTRETFARLGSDLNSYPLGYACAASSAFPILLTPLTVQNYGLPLDYSQDRNYLAKKDNARGNLNEDLTLKAWDYYNDKTNKYLHLADGGLVDNQGLQSILDEAVENTGLILKRINNTKSPLRRLIIVNLNAGVAPPNASGLSPAPPGVLSVVQSTMVASMDVLSARRWMDIKETCDQFNKTKIDSGDNSPYRLLEKPYAIEVNFRNILDAAKRKQAMELPTSFKLTPEQLKIIDEVVPPLLEDDPELKRLKEALAK